MHTFKYTSLILLSSSRQLTKYAAPPMHNKLCTTSFTFCNLSVCGLLRPCVQLHVCDCLLGLQRDLRGDTTITCSLTSETVCIRLPQGHWLLILWCRNKKLYSELLENFCWYRSYSSSTYFAFTCHVMTRYNQDISVQWSLSLYPFKQSSLSRGKWLDPLIQKTGNVLGDGSSFQTSHSIFLQQLPWPLGNKTCSTCRGGHSWMQGTWQNSTVLYLSDYQNIFHKETWCKSVEVIARECHMSRVGEAEMRVPDRCRRLYRQLARIKWTIYWARTKRSHQDRQLKGHHSRCIKAFSATIHSQVYF